VSTQRGFTIIEALIAIVILIGVMLSLVGIVPATFKSAERDSLKIQADAASQQYLDQLRQYIKSNGTNTGMPAAPTLAIDLGDQFAGSNSPMPSPSASAKNFTFANNGCPFIAGSSRMYDCSVTATWTEDGVSRTSSVESYVTAQN
jgi:type II secretory pathway pseudopilin PulG